VNDGFLVDGNLSLLLSARKGEREEECDLWGRGEDTRPDQKARH